MRKALNDPKKARDAKKAALATARATLKRQESILTRSEERRDLFTMRKYQREGFLNLPKDVVTAMKAAGFTWGGDWGIDSNHVDHKDMMHFDMP